MSNPDEKSPSEKKEGELEYTNINSIAQVLRKITSDDAEETSDATEVNRDLLKLSRIIKVGRLNDIQHQNSKESPFYSTKGLIEHEIVNIIQWVYGAIDISGIPNNDEPSEYEFNARSEARKLEAFLSIIQSVKPDNNKLGILTEPCPISKILGTLVTFSELPMTSKTARKTLLTTVQVPGKGGGIENIENQDVRINLEGIENVYTLEEFITIRTLLDNALKNSGVSEVKVSAGLDKTNELLTYTISNDGASQAFEDYATRAKESYEEGKKNKEVEQNVNKRGGIIVAFRAGQRQSQDSETDWFEIGREGGRNVVTVKFSNKNSS